MRNSGARATSRPFLGTSAVLRRPKKKLRKRTPLVSWQYLAFEHNDTKSTTPSRWRNSLGVDQFFSLLLSMSVGSIPSSPFEAAPRTVVFRAGGSREIIENWNPSSELQAEPSRSSPPVGANAWVTSDAGIDPDAPYLSLSLQKYRDGWHGPDPALLRRSATRMDLVFGNAKSGADLFNSEKYRLARLSFANPEQYRIEQASIDPLPGRFCDECEWEPQ